MKIVFFYGRSKNIKKKKNTFLIYMVTIYASENFPKDIQNISHFLIFRYLSKFVSQLDY